MVAQIITKQKAKFRIVIREVESGKSKTISLGNGTTLEEITQRVIGAFEK